MLQGWDKATIVHLRPARVRRAIRIRQDQPVAPHLLTATTRATDGQTGARRGVAKMAGHP